MPYIKQEKRVKFLMNIRDIVTNIESEGELNFVISKICKEYVNKKDIVKYEDYNKVMGVMACAMLEFYRKEVDPYEEEKIKENGEI